MAGSDRRGLERETAVEVYTGGGPGGQHRNKTQTAVRLHHLPTGLRASATERRSLAQNLATAFERLAAALARRNAPVKPRHATRVPPSEKRRRADDKSHRATHKRARARVRDDRE